MSRKDRKDRGGLKPTTIDLTASEVKGEPPEAATDTAGVAADPTPASDASPAERAPSAEGAREPAAEAWRDADPVRVEAAMAQAVDSERDAPPVDGPPGAPSPPSPPKQRSGSDWRVWTLGLLASAAIGAGGVWWLAGQGAASVDLAALESRLDTSQERLETLSREFADTKSALSQMSAGLADSAEQQQQAMAALNQRIAAAATGASDGVKAEIAGQRDAIARLDAAIGELKSAVAAASKGGDAGAAVAEAQMNLAELGARLDGLEQRLADALAQAGAAIAAPKALSAALGGLQTRVAEGAPFADELKAARAAAPQLAALTALEPLAATGAPTLDQLKASFAGAIAAVNAVSAPAAAPPQTWWDSVMAKLSGVVKVRHRSAVEWPEAVAAASTQLADNDLAAAVATLSRPSDPPPAVTDWRREAQARLAAEAALQDAMREAVRLMSGAANGG
jgi:hypothetical protein